MSCGSCGSNSGVPGGCKSHGSCKSGGCNRMNVHNWLADIPMHDVGKPYPIIEVSFNNGSRKDYYNNTQNIIFEKGDFVTVESSVGYDVGTVSLTGELVKLQLSKHGIKENSEDIKKILRASTPEEITKLTESKNKERALLIRSRAIIYALKLEMKLTEVELQADGRKATFYYVSDDRVDFRELIRLYAAEFGVKVEMKQIGIRQEAGKVGGLGSCGRELCCSTWLTDFSSVGTSAARYQNLSINQTKLSGQCGRLKCCLNYELDTYMDALKGFPNNAEKLQLASGTAYLQKKDIFKNLMWYTLADSSTHHPLTIERVNEIISLNKKGQKPEDLGAVELESQKTANIEKAEYADTVGLFTLKSLDKKARHNNNKKPRERGNSGVKPNTNNNSNRDGAPKMANVRHQPNNKPDKNKDRFGGNNYGGKKPPKSTQ